jgi:hypothetical protein
MAGDSLPPGSSDNEVPKSEGPKVKTFSCTNCGASVTIRNPGQSMSVVCESCHAIIDVTDENYEILSRYYKQYGEHSPRLALGTRGTLLGQKWEVIGFLVRTDVASAFSWEEYLLFNPYHGYRWLTENNGHWNIVRTIKEKPNIVTGGAAYFDNGELAGKEYELFYMGEAFIAYVLGEFYWKVAVGNNVQMADYICPPQMLSMEKDNREIIWSLSEYIEAKAIEEAFKPEKPMAQPIGVAANQKNEWISVFKKIVLLWGIFLVVLTCMQVMHVASASNKTVLESYYPYLANKKGSDTITTPVFFLDRVKSNLAVVFSADVDNCWFYVSGELVNNQTGETYPFERTVEYYHGYDSGEYWSEGSQSNQLMFSAIPGGEYYLNLDTESGGYPYIRQCQFLVSVKRDVPTYANYFWCLLFISIIPAIVWWQKRSFEIARWSESDFTPYQSADSN